MPREAQTLLPAFLQFGFDAAARDAAWHAIAGNLAVACRPGRRGWDISSFCKWWQIWQNINNAKSCQFLEDSSLVVSKPMFVSRF